MADEEVVSVEIHGQKYPIRSSLDPEYVARLARYVDEKMLAAAESTPTGDALRLAVLAALNVADEYFRACDTQQEGRASLRDRTIALERMVDLAIGLAVPGKAREQTNLDARLGLK